ncbi:MAG: hypothetical protein KA974_09515 [Saprospiraceae bacterium]|nr:hypothetical protein [Saprospiraceae bacterium]MBP7699542.1 hypothetical protein [Saprospiraceae bacterium]
MKKLIAAVLLIGAIYGSVQAYNKPSTDDALYCKKTVTNQDGSTTTTSCWFCNCSELN